jgi:hypothetical protein
MAASTLLSRGERSVEPSNLLVLAREVEGTSEVDFFLAIRRKGKQKDQEGMKKQKEFGEEKLEGIGSNGKSKQEQ